MPDMNTLASAVLNIKDLVSYQTGSVVSRTLIGFLSRICG